MLMWTISGVQHHVTVVLMAVLVTAMDNIPSHSHSVNNRHSRTMKTYNGDRVLRIEVPDSHTWITLNNILHHPHNAGGWEMWRPPDLLKSCDLHLTSRVLEDVMSQLNIRGVPYTTLIHDVQQLIDKEHQHHRLRRSTNKHSIVGKYADLDEITDWMVRLEKKYPQYVTLYKIGRTYEGRHMRLIKVGIPGTVEKKGVWIDAGFHSREWVSHSTAVYIIHKLIKGLRNESSPAHKLLRLLDFYILPVGNPDGYAYTHSTDRLWRKNRRPLNNNCTGVDINRNFRFQWGEGHTSSDPCSIMYHGEKPESEAETQHVTRFLNLLSHHILAYVSLHSYMQHFYTRYDYARSQYPSDHQQLVQMAQKAAQAIMAENGSLYHVGTAADILYSYGGGSADWAKAMAGIKYSYLIELRDSGQHGFLLPADQITPTGEETWAGIRMIGKELISIYNLTQPGYVPVSNKRKHGRHNTTMDIILTDRIQTLTYKEKPDPGIEIESNNSSTDEVTENGSELDSKSKEKAISTSNAAGYSTCYTVSVLYPGFSILLCHLLLH